MGCVYRVRCPASSYEIRKSPSAFCQIQIKYSCGALQLFLGWRFYLVWNVDLRSLCAFTVSSGYLVLRRLTAACHYPSLQGLPPMHTRCSQFNWVHRRLLPSSYVSRRRSRLLSLLRPSSLGGVRSRYRSRLFGLRLREYLRAECG